MAKVNKQLSNALLPWALPVLLVVVWQVASQAGWLSTRHPALAGEYCHHLLASRGQR